MILELLMHAKGWTDCWYAHPGPFLLDHTVRSVWKSIIREEGFRVAIDLFIRGHSKRWHIGVWTGPQLDLVCLKYCETSEEAERWLSPGGTIPLTAAIKGWIRMNYLECQ